MNDRAGKNRARPNRAGSVNFTEGSAEPARPSLDQNWPNLKPKIDQKCTLVSVHCTEESKIQIPINVDYLWSLLLSVINKKYANLQKIGPKNSIFPSKWRIFWGSGLGQLCRRFGRAGSAEIDQRLGRAGSVRSFTSRNRRFKR